MGEASGRHERDGNEYNISVRKSEGNGPLEGPRRRWDHGIKRYLRDMSVYWIHVAQDWDHSWAFAIMVMNLRVP
jgi:hypothetical protein